MKPDDRDLLNTLGVAQYRVGAYEEALSTLKQAKALYARWYPAGYPDDAAFTAMSLHQLGQTGAARTTLERLRTLIQEKQWQNNEEAQAFLAEAEALLGAGN